MATTLTQTLTVGISGTYTNALDFSNAAVNNSKTYTQALANGTSSNQADLMWYDQRSAAGAADDIDLTAVTCINPVTGAAQTYAEVVAIIIKNNSTTTTETLKIGGDGSGLVNWVGAAADYVIIGPSGVFCIWDPIDAYAVTATSADILQIDPGANTISYDIWIIGRSA